MTATDTRNEGTGSNSLTQRSGGALQKLIIPSFTYQLKHMNSKNITSDLKKDIPDDAGDATGVLLAGLLPFKTIWNRGEKPEVSVEKAGSITVVRQYGKSLVPLRLLRPDRRVQAVCRLGMKAYEAYFETAGRPDIIYAYDCLYAGVIAKMLHNAYGLPYIVIDRRPVNKNSPYPHLLLDIAREVLRDASSVHVIGTEPYRQLKDDFGDLDAVRNAMVV